MKKKKLIKLLNEYHDDLIIMLADDLIPVYPKTEEDEKGRREARIKDIRLLEGFFGKVLKSCK